MLNWTYHREDNMNTHTLERTSSREQYFAALCQISQTLISSLDLSEVLNAAMDTVIRLTRAERGFIMLVDKESVVAQFIARSGAPSNNAP